MELSLEKLGEIATNWKAADLSSLSILIKWYCEQTGTERPCMGCDLEKSDFMRKIIAYIAKVKVSGMNTKEWKLKTNSIFPFRYGGSVHISNANLTEERAIEFLRTNPNRISLFIQYPANWQELLDGNAEKAPILEAEKPKKKVKTFKK